MSTDHYRPFFSTVKKEKKKIETRKSFLRLSFIDYVRRKQRKKERKNNFLS